MAWNVKGQPIGDNGRELISVIGAKVREMVPIIYDNWKEKKDATFNEIKDKFWEEMQVYFFG